MQIANQAVEVTNSSIKRLLFPWLFNTCNSGIWEKQAGYLSTTSCNWFLKGQFIIRIQSKTIICNHPGIMQNNSNNGTTVSFQASSQSRFSFPVKVSSSLCSHSINRRTICHVLGSILLLVKHSYVYVSKYVILLHTVTLALFPWLKEINLNIALCNV